MAMLRAGQKVDVQVVIGQDAAAETTVRTALEDLTGSGGQSAAGEGTSQGHDSAVGDAAGQVRRRPTFWPRPIRARGSG